MSISISPYREAILGHSRMVSLRSMKRCCTLCVEFSLATLDRISLILAKGIPKCILIKVIFKNYHHKTSSGTVYHYNVFTSSEKHIFSLIFWLAFMRCLNTKLQSHILSADNSFPGA